MDLVSIETIAFIADGNYSSKYPRNEEFISEGVPFIRANNFENSTISDKDMLFISEEKHSTITKGHLKYNDVLITTRGNIGKTALVPKKHENSNINAQIVLLRCKENCYPKYLMHCFSIPFVKNQLDNNTTGTALKQLSVGNLRKIQIPLPPLETQKSIAEKLDKADALRKKDKELLKQYDELAQSIFIDMFGDPVQNEKGWDLINFEEVLKLKRGYDLPVQDRNQNGNIPVYGSNGILDYHTISKTNKPCIVTGRSGTIGKVHRTEQNCWPLNTTLYSYEIYDNNITYLEYLLNNLRIDRFAHGAGVPTLDRKIVHKEFIPNIKVELQNQFAEKIKNIEAQKELVKKQAEASENLFQALLQESFSFT